MLETNPNSSIACWTLINVDGATISGRFRTLDTVPIETRALRATWRTLTFMSEVLAQWGEKSRNQNYRTHKIVDNEAEFEQFKFTLENHAVEHFNSYNKNFSFLCWLLNIMCSNLVMHKDNNL